jgi:hypothetical protein
MEQKENKGFTYGYYMYSHSVLCKIIEAYGEWFKQHLDLEWDGYFITIMFHNIVGKREAKIQVMKKEIYKLYGRVATRAVRKPRSGNRAHLLPKAIFVPDVPAYKQSRYTLRDVTVNEGIYFHGVMVASKKARFKKPCHLLMIDPRLYVGTKICRIHVEPITSKVVSVTDYAGTAIKRERLPVDHVLVLPMTASELPTRHCSQAQDEHTKAIKDIQSSMNVSEEVAEFLDHNPRKVT